MRVFTTAAKFTGGKVSLANNSNTNIVANGTARVIADVYGKNTNLALNDTLLVPDLRSNLISVSKITDRKLSLAKKTLKSSTTAEM